MVKKDYQNNKQPNYRPVLFDKLKNLRNGSISIIKQDSIIVQINVFERILIPGGETH